VTFEIFKAIDINIVTAYVPREVLKMSLLVNPIW
jgi:hypothetical protein